MSRKGTKKNEKCKYLERNLIKKCIFFIFSQKSPFYRTRKRIETGNNNSQEILFADCTNKTKEMIGKKGSVWWVEW